MSTHRSVRGSLRIAMMGTRGVPARYGGFETAVEEVGKRLVERGHRVTVYCRPSVAPGVVGTDAHSAAGPGQAPPDEHLGMARVELPAMRSKALETLSHTALSVLRSCLRQREDVVFLFNSANAPFLPVLRARGVPVAVHVDGLEWSRAKWAGAGRGYYRAAERLAVRWADALIADAMGIADYYRAEFGASTELLSYGAPILTDCGDAGIAELGLEPGRYHLVVARFEPENHVQEIVAGMALSDARMPLVVIGGAPYNDRYTAAVNELAAGDDRIRLLGPVWDQALLDRLYCNALLYLHGHSVGGTNPSLLRAMGAGTAVAAWDVSFNREVLGTDGRYVASPEEVATAVESAEADPSAVSDRGRSLRRRAAACYRWDDVADGYESLALLLARGWSRAGEASGARKGGGGPRQTAGSGTHTAAPSTSASGRTRRDREVIG